MGREIRNVPPHWEHPQRPCGHNPRCKYPNLKEGYHSIPLYNRNYKKECEEWYKKAFEFKHDIHEFYHEYAGNPPDKDRYVEYGPDAKENTWVQLYETVSEGTPVSPAFATKEELADYLAENGDYWDQRRRQEGSFMPCEPWGKEAAYKFVFGAGWAPSLVINNGKVMSGVEFTVSDELNKEENDGK